jgi:hypothetical protein
LVLEFNSKKDEEKIIELGDFCINIAYGMIYDAAIYLKDYKILMDGLTILKYIYRKGNKANLSTLIDKVDKTYLNISLDFVRVFKEDIKAGPLTYPPLPEHLHKIIYP